MVWRAKAWILQAMRWCIRANTPECFRLAIMNRVRRLKMVSGSCELMTPRSRYAAGSLLEVRVPSSAHSLRLLIYPGKCKKTGATRFKRFLAESSRLFEALRLASGYSVGVVDWAVNLASAEYSYGISSMTRQRAKEFLLIGLLALSVRVVMRPELCSSLYRARPCNCDVNGEHASF
jgi:hypothetical protein